jgi:hypothetical protein
VVEIAIVILLLPFGALCLASTLHIYKREQRQHRQWLYDQSQNYQFQWQEFEAQHKKNFESDYWNTSTNSPERLEHGR